MVCKKFQVYDWFRTLDGAKRIDFLNGMLHLCFPLELRFLGSCIEELARKEYTYLRDAEIKANTVNEIQLMKDIADKVTRSKMIVSLALLASNNYECARLLYDLLNVDIVELLDRMKLWYGGLDEKIADEFLLLLTMAANHPAFDFQMKTKMSQLYFCAEQKLKQNKIILKESESDMCLCDNNNQANISSNSSTTKNINNNNNNNIENNLQNDNNNNTNALEQNSLIDCTKEVDNNNNTSNNNNQQSSTNAHGVVVVAVGAQQQQPIDPSLTSSSSLPSSCNSNVNIKHELDEINNKKLNDTKQMIKSSVTTDDINSLSKINSNYTKNNVSSVSSPSSPTKHSTTSLNSFNNLNNNNISVPSSTNTGDIKNDLNHNTDAVLIESINFEGVQTIKGTDNYKFLIKV